MFLREFTDNIKSSKDVEDYLDDLLFFMDNDPMFYRKQFFPLISKFQAYIKKNKNCNRGVFIKCIKNAKKEYCEKFDIDENHKSLSDDKLKELSGQIYDREIENLKKSKESVQEDAAGVGIITKQNTTADVGPGTIKKNLKAFSLDEASMGDLSLRIENDLEKHLEKLSKNLIDADYLGFILDNYVSVLSREYDIHEKDIWTIVNDVIDNLISEKFPNLKN